MFRQKDPKPWAPGRGPSGAFAPVPKVRAAELASLKQSSPPTGFRDCGAATPAGALRWRHVMARVGRLTIKLELSDYAALIRPTALRLSAVPLTRGIEGVVVQRRGRMRGLGPARRGSFALLRTGSFVSAKGPKTIGAQAWPFGCLCPGPDCEGCGTRFAQTVLAPNWISGLRRSLARRRPEVAPCDGAGRKTNYKVVVGRVSRRRNPTIRWSLPVLDYVGVVGLRCANPTYGSGCQRISEHIQE